MATILLVGVDLFFRGKLEGLGSLKRQELITAVIVAASIFLWATQSTPNQVRLHPFPSYIIGMVALTAFALTGILQDGDIANGVSWTLRSVLRTVDPSRRRDIRQVPFAGSRMENVDLTLRQSDIASIRRLVHRDSRGNQRANQTARRWGVGISRDVTVGQSHFVAETEAVFDEVHPKRRGFAARGAPDVAHDT